MGTPVLVRLLGSDPTLRVGSRIPSQLPWSSVEDATSLMEDQKFMLPVGSESKGWA